MQKGVKNIVRLRKDSKICTIEGCDEPRKRNGEKKTLCHYHEAVINRKEYQEVCCEKCFVIYDVRKRWPDDVTFSVIQGLCSECKDRADKSKPNSSVKQENS